jgi:hypothetical protein
MKRTILTLLLIALPFAAVQAADWQEVEKDGVLHVVNPKDGSEKPVSLEPEEMWRIGGEDDEEIFGVITDIIADDEGNFYLLDAQLSEIKVYSEDGEYLRTIGREGEGPGEFRGAFNMFRVPGGNIGVLQTFPGKIVVLTPDGDPAGDFPLPDIADEGFRVLLGAQYAGDKLAMTYMVNQPSQEGFSQNNHLALVDKDGTQETRLHSQKSTFTVAAAIFAEKEWDSFRNRWTAAPDGRAFSPVNFGQYAINMWSPEGKLDRVIERDYPDHVRNAEDNERLLGIYKGFTRQIPVPNVQYELEENWNPVQQLWARDDGSLWVQTSRGSQGLDDGILGIFDVFDKSGHFIKQMTLKGEGDPTADGYFFVRDRLFVVTDWLNSLMALQGGGRQAEEEEEMEEEDALMEIVSYQVK